MLRPFINFSRPLRQFSPTLQNFSTTARAMGVEKTIIREGDGPSPKKGDQVTMEYTGWLRADDKPEQKGKQFDSTTGRGSFQTAIGVGRVIRGMCKRRLVIAHRAGTLVLIIC